MLKRSICFSISLIAACVGMFIGAASLLVSRPISFKAPNAYEIPAEVSLATEVIAADPIARTFTMDWYPTFNAGCPPNISKVVDIYVDRGVLDSSSPGFSILPPYSPAYRYNLTAHCKIETSLVHAFRTISKLLISDQSFGYPGSADSSLQNYPFDVYFAPFYIYGVDPDSGEYVTLNVTRSFGQVVTPPNRNFQVEMHRSGTVKSPPWLFYTLRVSRSQATKIFVVVVGISNWLTAAAFLTISLSTFIYSNHKIYSEMFVVPVGAVFAFTTIRANFPGAPNGFGARIDLFTILPVLIFMSFCSFFLLLIVLYRRIVESGEINRPFILRALPYPRKQKPPNPTTLNRALNNRCRIPTYDWASG